MAKVYLAFLDDGHGANTSGKRTPYVPEYGRQIRENEFNKAVVNLLNTKLKSSGVTPILVAPTDADTPLSSRTSYANQVFNQYKNKYGSKNVDAVYISVHYDALSHNWSSAEGHTIFVYIGNKKYRSGTLANNIAKYLRQGTRQQWRGVREANFYVLRKTTMPAVLTENGFMSNKREALLMLNKSFQNECATEHAQGICDYWNLRYAGGSASTPSTPSTPKKPASGTTLYRVVAGSFTTRANANAQIANLKNKGFSSFIDIYKSGGITFYRVVAGSFSSKTNANNQVAALKKAGISAFLTAVTV